MRNNGAVDLTEVVRGRLTVDLTSTQQVSADVDSVHCDSVSRFWLTQDACLDTPCVSMAYARITVACVHEHFEVSNFCEEHIRSTKINEKDFDHDFCCDTCRTGARRHLCRVSIVKISPLGDRAGVIL